MKQINTLLLKSDIEGINTAATLLKNGGLVAIPTETVYGLAANALNAEAVENIFKAKGRAQDNPLIVHISDFDMIDELITELPQKALLLAAAFWPGPLTMVLKKSANVPDIVSCGLNSVGIRMPSNITAREIISQSGCPLAAPSANISGSVSPTTAQHCFDDLGGKIDAIVDGGKCDVGLESTVISLLDETPVILRPGFITQDDIERVIGTTKMHSTAESDLKEGQTAASPGMKYKHYSPKAKVFVLNGESTQYINYVNQKQCFALCFDEDINGLTVPFVSLGSETDQAEQASKLFSSLRALDDMSASVIFARCPSKNGIGLAIYNRLLRAASFNIIDL